jgi:predicted ferric reductase
MKLGDDIELDGPLGYFFMHDTFEPTIFLAGGIGIVPFRSFLLEEQAQGWPHSIMLFYSVGQIKNAAFLEELSDMQNEKFKIILTLTHSQESWPVVTNEKGRISGEMINKHVPNLSSHYCYIVGSPIMVSDIYYQLNELGVDPRKIVTEPFTGY